MTRMDSVRAATDSAKESVLHAAEAVAPYADTAKEQAAQYAEEARARLTPKVSKAARQARVQYGAHVAPRVPPKVDMAAHLARKAARCAVGYTVPRVEHAVAVAQPVAGEAAARSAAALAALRGQITAKELRKLVKKHERRAKNGRRVKGLVVLAVLAGGAVAAWKWWDKQANPDWLVEPPAPTEVSEHGSMSSVDGSRAGLDPEVRAKQAEEESKDRDDRP